MDYDLSDRDEALDYVRDHHWDAVREVVESQIVWESARAWNEGFKTELAVINCVGEFDKEYSRRRIRRWLADDYVQSPASAEADEPDDEESFQIASRIAGVLEEHNSPYLETCNVGDDLSWVRSLIGASRATRDLIIFLSDGDFGSDVLDATISRFNSFLTAGPPVVLRARDYSSSRPKGKNWRLSTRRDPSLTPLHAALTQGMVEYFTLYRDDLDLAVCLECSRIFQRARRDNAYCSKTCQNRVAYKRRRVIDSGLLKEEPPENVTIDSIRPGLWVSHPRWGLGVVEQVSFFTERKPERPGFRKIKEPKSLVASTRYLSGVVRPLSWSDLFDPSAKSRVTVYEVLDRAELMKFL